MLLKVLVSLCDDSSLKSESPDFTVSKPYINGDNIEFQISKENSYIATELANNIIGITGKFKYKEPAKDVFDDYDYTILTDGNDADIEKLLEKENQGKIHYELTVKKDTDKEKKETHSVIVYVAHKNISKQFFQRLIYQIELKNITKKTGSKEKITFAYQNYQGQRNCLSRLQKLLIAAYRDYYHLARLPTNVIHPDSLVEMYKHIISVYGLENSVVFKEQIVDEKTGFGGIYSVGKGSQYKPRLLTVEFGYNTEQKDREYSVAVCGKGVCYDTGGLSLKPTCSMVDMYTDKAGSVLGFLSSLVYYKIYKKPILYATGIVENSIGSYAYRPGDVIDSYSGKKIHIGNTDAEGRVVLADVLAYVSKNYQIKYLIASATLTGAAKVVCGADYCPYVILGDNIIFSKGDSLEKIIDEIKKETGEYLVKLPSENLFVDSYIENAGRYGDISNVTKHRCEGSHGPAHFLNYFIQPDKNNNKPCYIHQDIANYFEEDFVSSSDLLEFNVTLYDKLNS